MTQDEEDAYFQGWEDYHEGFSPWSCPYRDPVLADAWEQGWQDAESAQGWSTV